MNVLSLCSGIGGLDLGLKIAAPEARTVCWVERDDNCRRVLLARMADGSLDAAPLWDDLTTFDGKPWAGVVDCVTAGFPCQDISNAGRRAGIQVGNRSGLWFEVARVIGEVAPRVAFLENVGALLGRGMDTVLGDLSDLGFDAVWGIVSAADVGAPHLRRRVFILAHAQRLGDRADQQELVSGSGREANACVGLSAMADAAEQRIREPDHEASAIGARRAWPDSGSGSVPVGEPTGTGLAEWIGEREDGIEEQPAAERTGLPRFPPGPADTDAWRENLARDPSLEPALCGVAARVPARMDRLRALGNAVVPLQAALGFRLLARRIGD